MLEIGEWDGRVLEISEWAGRVLEIGEWGDRLNTWEIDCAVH